MTKILFGSLSYETEEELTQTMIEMDQVAAVAILVAASAFANGKGVYSEEESKILIKSIQTLMPKEMLNGNPIDLPNDKEGS